MLSRASIIALGLASFLAFAIVTFPASIALRWFAPDELALASVHGTIWRGRAVHGAAGGIAFSDLAWRLNPAALITAKVDLIVDEIRIGNGSARAQVTASGNGADITIVDAIMDLQPFRDALSLGDVSGQFSSRELRLKIQDGWPVSVTGELRIGGLAVPPLIPIAGVSRVLLGNFRAEFTASDEPGIVTLLNDEGGPIELTGSFKLLPDRSFELDTLIKPRADAPEVLVQGIELVSGPPDAEGRRLFRQTGLL